MEKLIYVHVARLGDSLHRKRDMFSGCDNATNDWYVIKQRSEGRGDRVKMSRVFEDAGQLNYPDFALMDTDCVVVRSRLYVIGGCCMMCHSGTYDCEYLGSTAIRCLDTRNPEDGWRTCFTLPLRLCVTGSAVVDGHWFYLFPSEEPWWYGFNVKDGKSVRKLPQPGNCSFPPSFCSCLSPGTLVAYRIEENTLYQLDCKNSAWTVYHKDFLPYSFQELGGSSFAVDDDGILYIYLCLNLRLISFDIRNKKELHAVDLPKSFWFGLDDPPVQLMVLSKNKFCLLWDRVGTSMNKRRIYYSRFSVSYDDLPYSTLDVEETRSFLVAGYRVLNAVTVTMNTDECIGANVKPAWMNKKVKFLGWDKGEEIGSGAHGNVYVARHRKTRAICGAVKELNIYKADAFEYIRKEIKFFSQLEKHPNIVEYYGHKEEVGRFSLYMEYIQPGSLKKYISESKRGKLDGPLIQNFTAQILSGLVHLHSNKLVHGDLKPDNVLVDSKNIVKLVDFGLAKLLAKSVGRHSVGGTTPYAAPEVLYRKKYPSLHDALAADIWSVACVIIEMFSGIKPWFESDSDSDSDSVFVVKQHPQIPRALCQDGKDFLKLCFKIRPPKRPSAEELLKHPFVCKSTS